ncbi:MAG: 30S ribosomal protein S8 [Gammaproteobacteria bacterium]
MSMQDPISDMFTRIRNAQARSRTEVSMPTSTKKIAIAEVLEKEGYILGYEKDDSGDHPQLVIKLKYYDGRPVIEKIKRESRPGLRVYRGKNDLPSIVGGLGIAIVSTSKGVMTEREARSQGIGGEVICSVY